MNENPLARTIGNKEYPQVKKAQETQGDYLSYVSLGGLINEKDYIDAFEWSKTGELDMSNPSVRSSKHTAVHMAEKIGIELNTNLDEITKLYSKLRLDERSAGHSHVQLSDQVLFGQVLLMLGDTDSYKKLIKFYPNIFPEQDESIF